jgi:transcription termination factor NusB
MNEKRSQLKIEIDPSTKVHHFIGEYFEKNGYQDEIVEEVLSDGESLSDSQEIISNKPLFKKTISRMVAMQVFATILGDDSYFAHCGKSSLNGLIDEVMKFVIENNNYEWSYFKNKQISKNYTIQIVKFLNENFDLLSQKLSKCSSIYKYNNVMKAIVYGVIGEYMMIQDSENPEQKDYKNILINEYILIAEYFLDENHVRLLNGLLESLFAQMRAPIVEISDDQQMDEEDKNVIYECEIQSEVTEEIDESLLVDA